MASRIRKRAFVAVTLLLVVSVTVIGCATPTTRDTKADVKLSQKKVPPDAAKTAELLKEPQTGFSQEPKEEV